MFLEAHGSLSPVQLISRCVSSVRVQANGTTWSSQQGCLPTRQPLLRVCPGGCHSGSQAGGRSDTVDSVLRADLDPADTDWTLPWDVPAGSPRTPTQVGTGPRGADLCVVPRKTGVAQAAVGAGAHGVERYVVC